MPEGLDTGSLGSFMARVNRAVEEARAKALEVEEATKTGARAPDRDPPNLIPDVSEDSPHPGRPFYNHSVDEMEEFWEECDQDLDVAETLLEELHYRTSPEARALEWWLRRQL